MSAKEQAIQDIKSELEKQGKCFLAFKESLNPIMDSIVKRELQIREKASYCMSTWSLG